jgi:hypothetical protein
VATDHITGDAPAALSLAEPDAILSFGRDVGRKVVLGKVYRRHCAKAETAAFGLTRPMPRMTAEGQTQTIQVSHRWARSASES